MSKSTYGFELPDSFFETQRILKKITASMDVLNNINRELLYTQNMSGITAAAASMQSVLRAAIPIDTTQALFKSVASMQTILANVQLPKAIDLIPTIEKILPAIDNTWKMPTIDWEWLSQNIDSLRDFDDPELDAIVTEDVYEELEESVQETIISGTSQKNIEAKYGEWKNQHPLLADLYLQLISLILAVLSGLIVNWLSGILIKPANVYEEPKSSSNIVVNINVDQNVTIVNEVPYYYEILYMDSETGEEKTGYVYKNNIEIVDEDEGK